jgi:hypothetical protein
MCECQCRAVEAGWHVLASCAAVSEWNVRVKSYTVVQRPARELATPNRSSGVRRVGELVNNNNVTRNNKVTSTRGHGSAADGRCRGQTDRMSSERKTHRCANPTPARGPNATERNMEEQQITTFDRTMLQNPTSKDNYDMSRGIDSHAPRWSAPMHRALHRAWPRSTSTRHHACMRCTGGVRHEAPDTHTATLRPT